MADIAGVLFGCGVGLFGLFVALLIGSVLVRAAVALANRVLRPAEVPPDTFGQWDDWDSDEPAPKRRKKSARVIPEPSLATGMLVTFLSGLVNPFSIAALAVVAGAQLDDPQGLDELLPFALVALLLPVGFALFTLLLRLLLPTTFWRAALVAFFHTLIVVVVALGAGAAVYLAWNALGA